MDKNKNVYYCVESNFISKKSVNVVMFLNQYQLRP
jgi:hypothetical protein